MDVPMDWCTKCRADLNWCFHLHEQIRNDRKKGSKKKAQVDSWCNGDLLDWEKDLLCLGKGVIKGVVDATGKLINGGKSSGGGDSDDDNIQPATDNSALLKINCPPPAKLATLPPVVIQPSWPHPQDWRPSPAAAALSGGAIAGITIGAIFLFLLLLGGCVALFIFVSRSGKSGKGGSSSNKKSINIITNVNKDNISKGTGLKKKSSKKSGKKSSKKSSKGLVLKKKSSVKTGKSSRKLLILKKRSSQGSSAASSAKGSFAASSAKGSSAASRFSTSGKPSSAGSKKGSSAVSKKSSFASQKGSTKGSFASSKKASSFASSKAPSKAPSKASIKKALA